MKLAACPIIIIIYSVPLSIKPRPPKRNLECITCQYPLLPTMLPKLGQIVTVMTAARNVRERTIQAAHWQYIHGPRGEPSAILVCSFCLVKMFQIIASSRFYLTKIV